MSQTNLQNKKNGMDLRKILSMNINATIGSTIVIFLLIVAFFAPLIAPYSPDVINPANRLLSISREHLFGTDGFGRDVFSRVIFGTRISLIVGFSVSIITTLVGIVLGFIAGYYRAVDNLIMRILDGFMAFPAIILQIMIMAVLGSSLLNVIIALSIAYSPKTARVFRSAVIAQKEQQYVEAARSIGANDFRIIIINILPNCIAPIIIQATTVFAYSILSEAALSFLGVGVPPEIPTWGNILSEGRVFISRAPWIIWSPGLTIATCVLAINMFGDGIRDILDPKIRNKQS